jgi:hypothetical protein
MAIEGLPKLGGCILKRLQCTRAEDIQTVMIRRKSKSSAADLWTMEAQSTLEYVDS